MTEQRREYFRVEYPVIERPVLVSNTGRFEVLDVSEFGVRFADYAAHAFAPGMQLLARLQFNDGYEFSCYGLVLRCDHDLVGVQLLTPIPLKRIHVESAHLMQAYHARFAS
jgi:hypothetical protein